MRLLDDINNLNYFSTPIIRAFIIEAIISLLLNNEHNIIGLEARVVQADGNTTLILIGGLYLGPVPGLHLHRDRNREEPLSQVLGARQVGR